MSEAHKVQQCIISFRILYFDYIFIRLCCQAKESTPKNSFDYIELEDYNNTEKIVSGG